MVPLLRYIKCYIAHVKFLSFSSKIKHTFSLFLTRFSLVVALNPTIILWKLCVMEAKVEVRFSGPVHTVTGAHPASHIRGTGSFPGVKRPECGVNHPLQSSAEFKEILVLYLCSPSVSPWLVIGWTLPFALGDVVQGVFYMCDFIHKF